MNSKATKTKADYSCGDSKAPANVNSLRKLFENNFKLSNITKPFKSKNKSVDVANVVFDEDPKGRRFTSSHSKENRNENGLIPSPAGCYLNCKIENCCCKTFFRQYTETPIKYGPLPKVPLQELNGNSTFDRHRPERWSVTSSYNLSKQQLRNLQPHDLSRNKFYSINYEFYKSKSQEIFDETPVSAVSTKRLDRLVSKTGRKTNLLEKISNDDCHNAFVKFTAASLNEGGYMRTAKHFEPVERENIENEVSKPKSSAPMTLTLSDTQKIADVDQEAHRAGGFGFKCRLPKLKSIGLRENSHPYNVKKPRLTVKGVKNRNMRNVKRRQKQVEGSTLCRSQTFSGYDNFAYRRSVGDLQSKQKADAKVKEPEDVTVAASSGDSSGKEIAAVRGSRPASISVVGVDDGPHFHLDSRMTCYDWPVTSFYIERSEKQAAPRRASSSFDLNAKQPSLEKNANPVARKTNLKRHCSLGYLDEEFFEYNFTKHRRSLENVNKASGIRPIPEANKLIDRRKFQNLDVHVHALFAAVEHGYVEKTKTILESSNVNVNSVNSDGLSPLDVALLSNNKSLVKLLVAYGAQEGRKYYGADMRNHLCHLLHEAESRVQELSGCLRLNIDPDQSSTSILTGGIPAATIGSNVQNKTFSIWDRRAKGLKRMLMGFEQIRPPDPPSAVTVEVTSTSSIMVYFTASESEKSSMTTKFKVQLSSDEDFLCLCGHYEVADTRQLKYQIKNLCQGQPYYVRVASGNIKGYSAYKLSTPAFIVPSSWRDISKKDSRFSDSLRDTLDGIFTSVLIDHPYLRNNAELYGQGTEVFINQRRKKTSIKQLFTASSKFQKHLKRGIYLACLMYHEDKVLVTNEDFLPVIEVDENYPRKIHNDFHWFFKIACNWKDLKWMKNDMERLQNSSAVFRIKLLQAAAHMQTALNIQELGKLYYKMLRDVEGTIVISTINHIQSPKSVSVLNLRWLPLTKLHKKSNLVNFMEVNLSDVLIASIPEQIAYHQVSKIKLPRGLYLSYLKTRSSVDSLQVLVPFRTPHIPPHCKIRDNPHVTTEEWQWLVKKENLRENLASATHQQRLFVEQIVITTRRLFTYMNIGDEEAVTHRLYDAEVIEVNKDVSLIMIVPSAEACCAIPDQREVLSQRPPLLPLTVQAFEMAHFETYQLHLISLYSRLSCVIEMDVDFAQHGVRQAFNDLEISSARNKLHELEMLQAKLNTAWKKCKWLLDVISYARDKFSVPHLSMRQLLNMHPKRALSLAESNCDLQSPKVKPTESRGSWLDAGVGRHVSRVPYEISRSEQHLTSGVLTAFSTPGTYNLKTKLPMRRSESEEIMNVTHSSNISAPETRNSSRSKKYHNSLSAAGNSFSGSIHSFMSDDMLVSSSKMTRNQNGTIKDSVSSPAVVKVYAAYNTGLDTQNYFKFHVSSRTTVRDIVDMFVKQTNMSVVLEGKECPIYSDEELPKFCLVSVDETGEHSLCDDLRLERFQRLWKDGRLYVRRRSSLLASPENDSQSSYV